MDVERHKRSPQVLLLSSFGLVSGGEFESGQNLFGRANEKLFGFSFPHGIDFDTLYGKNLWRDSAAASKHRHFAISLCIVLITSFANYTKIARSKRF